MYKVKLANGTVLKNLSMNGNNFVSTAELTEDVFDGNLSPVIIVDPDGNSVTHPHMDLVQVDSPEPGKWYFILRDLTEDELWRAKVEGNVTYIAMMTDIEL